MKKSYDTEAAAQEALDAFWQVIVHRFPEATTGDLSPETTIGLHEAARLAVEEWVETNVPSKLHA